MNPSITKDDTVSGLRTPSQAFSGNSAGDVKHDLNETANVVGHKVREFVDTANSELTQTTKTVSAHIHAKPVQSAFIALGLGYVLAALIRR